MCVSRKISSHNEYAGVAGDGRVVGDLILELCVHISGDRRPNRMHV